MTISRFHYANYSDVSTRERPRAVAREVQAADDDHEELDDDEADEDEEEAALAARRAAKEAEGDTKVNSVRATSIRERMSGSGCGGMIRTGGPAC